MNVKNIIFVIILFMAAISAAVFLTAMPSFRKDPSPVRAVIPKGSSARQISLILKNAGVIRSRVFFLALSRISGKAGDLKQGTYLFEKNHYVKIINMLQGGLTFRVKVTIPEGFSACQIAEKFQKEGVISDKEHFYGLTKDSNLEGMLFPETYYFEPNSAPEAVINEMTRQFRSVFNSSFTARAREINMTENEILTLASIIEREAREDAERPKISSVYHNRLKKKMPLEADPTVQYALSEGSAWKERLLYEDLKVKSPYNTYRRAGLPPGPICSPGKKSIEAALYPAHTAYLYFVADGNGGHSFAETLKDHIKNKQEYKKRKAK